MDVRKETVIFPNYQRSFGKLIVIRQPLAASHAIAGVGQMMRLNGLQSSGFVPHFVLLPQNSARALPLARKEDMDLSLTVGSTQDVELRYLLLLTSVLRLLSGSISTPWEEEQESDFSVGDEEVLYTCLELILEVCLLSITYIPTLDH